MQVSASASRFSRGGFGRRLAAVRNALSLNAPTFADQLGFPRRTYLTWEREEADPPARLLLLLGRDYDVDIVWLLDGPGEEIRYGSARLDWDRFSILRKSLRDLASQLGLNPSEDQVIDAAREILEGPANEDESSLRHIERHWRLAGKPSDG